MRIYRIAWVALIADAAYWLYSIGHSREDALPAWHVTVNLVTFYGGWLLLVVLTVVALTHRRSA